MVMRYEPVNARAPVVAGAAAVSTHFPRRLAVTVSALTLHTFGLAERRVTVWPWSLLLAVWRALIFNFALTEPLSSCGPALGVGTTGVAKEPVVKLTMLPSCGLPIALSATSR